MTQWSLLGLLMGVGVIVSGCAVLEVKETQYLKSVEGKASQAEVRKELGAPRVTTETPDGGSTWVYEVRQLEPGSQNSWASTGSWCDEYTLTFDKAGVLRQWTHHSYLHGGETQPISCNSILGVQKSSH